MRMRKMALATVGTVLALGGGLATTGPASAAQSGGSDFTVMATCGEPNNVYIPGGESHYTVDCGPTTTRVSGTLKDTRADGMCVQLKIWWPAHQSYTYTDKACGNGTKVSFDHNGRTGSPAPSVYTYTV
ncbi:hypothetical protein ACIO87_29300 [Streptomyces sp. NPDC087218]|uniref:hypothetical protein n=1 Tax=Streptomyces sp. NPDC087218 TaxID=3365769 RepID=UPI0037FF7829